VDDAPTPNELTTVTAAGPVRANPNFSFAFARGLSLFSLGLQPTVTDLGVLFHRTGPGMDFARWDPALGADGSYHRYSDNPADPFLAQATGRGFWLLTDQPLALSISGAPLTTDAQVNFLVGWNQLGNPFDGDVAASDMQVNIFGTLFDLTTSNESGYTADYFWTYDNASASYRLVSQTLPFAEPVVRKGQGFFFFSNRQGQLVIPRPVSTAAAAKTAAAAAAASDSNWALKLVAAVDGAADTDNFMGVSSQAAARNGVVSPPAQRNGLTCYSRRKAAVRPQASAVTSRTGSGR
jgi:hypothetical protein